MGIGMLPDNHKTDRYFYQIIVFTGHRKDAGTQSKVSHPGIESNPLDLIDGVLCRCTSCWVVMMMKQVFGPLLILIERSFSVVASMLSSWLCQSRSPDTVSLSPLVLLSSLTGLDRWDR